jgi:hypothetical protein
MCIPCIIIAYYLSVPTNAHKKLIGIQPLGRFWQEPEPSQATGMALARCILGRFLGVVCHCFPLKCTYINLNIILYYIILYYIILYYIILYYKQYKLYIYPFVGTNTKQNTRFVHKSIMPDINQIMTLPALLNRETFSCGAGLPIPNVTELQNNSSCVHFRFMSSAI